MSTMDSTSEASLPRAFASRAFEAASGTSQPLDNALAHIENEQVAILSTLAEGRRSADRVDELFTQAAATFDRLPEYTLKLEKLAVNVAILSTNAQKVRDLAIHVGEGVLQHCVAINAPHSGNLVRSLDDAKQRKQAAAGSSAAAGGIR